MRDDRSKPPLVFTIKEVAKLVKLSEDLVLQAIHEGRLKAQRLGGKKAYRILNEWVWAWVDGPRAAIEQRKAAADQMGAEMRSLVNAVACDPQHADDHIRSYNRRKARCRRAAH